MVGADERASGADACAAGACERASGAENAVAQKRASAAERLQCRVIIGIKVLFEVLFYGIAVPGYPSLLVAVVVLGGLNLALLGLVGEYVWVAVSESKDRPIYVLRDVISAPEEPHSVRQEAGPA